jgi:DNA-binding response OmpR family regulator
MNPATVVHVDDNPIFLQAFRDLMVQRGIEVESYFSSDAADVEIGRADSFIAVVDSAGFEFASRLRSRRCDCLTIILSSRPPADSSLADAVILKGSWRAEVIEQIGLFIARHNLDHRERLNVFSEPDARVLLRGKIAIVHGRPEAVVGTATGLREALEFIERANLDNCRLVQGPPAQFNLAH